MSYKLEVIEPGIIRTKVIGDLDTETANAYMDDFVSILDSATETPTWSVLANVSQQGNVTGAGRRTFVNVNKDPRVGKVAVAENHSRFIKVLADFVLLATRRSNIQFFDTEAEALAWLRLPE